MTRVAQRAVSRPIVRYHGGKWKLAPWVISHMPLHRIYVEPFGGGASVLLRKPRSYAEVYNDQWHTIVNVFRVLRDPVKAERLRQIIELTPYSRDEFFAAYHDEGDDDVERARKTILRSFAGFGPAATNGEHITGFRGNCGRSGMTPAHDWRNYPGQVPAFVERLQAVIIESRPAQDVIAAHDSHQTLFYVDPPYPHSTRNMSRGNAAYAVEMTDEDHERRRVEHVPREHGVGEVRPGLASARRDAARDDREHRQCGEGGQRDGDDDEGAPFPHSGRARDMDARFAPCMSRL